MTNQAFNSEQVIRLTGITRRRLNYWIESEVISADVDAARGRGHVRLWSFQSLVEVRVAVALREELSLQRLRKVVQALRREGLPSPLAQVRVYVQKTKRGDRVVIRRPDGSLSEPLTGQQVMELPLPLDEYAAEIQTAVEADRKRRRQVGEVERRRGRLGSAPTFAGTRIPVAAVQRMLKAGRSDDEILADYPGLDAADIEAARSA